MWGCIVFAVELLGEQLGHGGGEVTLAQRDHTDGFHNFGGLAFLVEITTGPLANQIDGVMLFGVAAQNQNAHVGCFRTQHGQGIQTTLAGHRKVHQQYVDFVIAHQVNRLAAIRGFAFYA